ncbi:NADPH-dependent F420 reductase [Haloarcula sp. H-GB4]|uniref:NADPH-dependent F420 reductase n=1 Tax=Haloarcula sp. H-GB4 TaxID=3069755 RepID=UPI0027AF2E72|nr:NADPH-dependent F420 reductase [Haloarcula sp. H-GB4]MDQ2074603.1 NADPH-dependent F420 reductase [Haloarcula sp. H-GB4]
MELAILGGTGDIGEGLAMRFVADTDHTITIGSRDAAKASERARTYEERLSDHGVETEINGTDNSSAAASADVVILAIPPHHVGDTVEALAEDDALSDQLLISPAVGMNGDGDGLHYRPPSTGSVTEFVAERAPESVPVAGAFHNLAADRLADLEATLDVDTLVVADDPAVSERVVALTADLTGVRPIPAGPLSNAAEVESLTPLLINIARYNEDMHDVGVSFS